MPSSKVSSFSSNDQSHEVISRESTKFQQPTVMEKANWKPEHSHTNESSMKLSYQSSNFKMKKRFKLLSCSLTLLLVLKFDLIQANRQQVTIQQQSPPSTKNSSFTAKIIQPHRTSGDYTIFKAGVQQIPPTTLLQIEKLPLGIQSRKEANVNRLLNEAAKYKDLDHLQKKQVDRLLSLAANIVASNEDQASKESEENGAVEAKVNGNKEQLAALMKPIKKEAPDKEALKTRLKNKIPPAGKTSEMAADDERAAMKEVESLPPDHQPKISGNRDKFYRPHRPGYHHRHSPAPKEDKTGADLPIDEKGFALIDNKQSLPSTSKALHQDVDQYPDHLASHRSYYNQNERFNEDEHYNYNGPHYDSQDVDTQQHHHHHPQPLNPAAWDDSYKSFGEQVVFDNRYENQSSGEYPDRQFGYDANNNNSYLPEESYSTQQQEHQTQIDKRHSPNIKVVFNNNPQFIIGKDHNAVQGEWTSTSGGSYPLTRKTRQPSASFYDDYRSDETNPRESRINPNPETRILDSDLTNATHLELEASKGELELPCDKDKSHRRRPQKVHPTEVKESNLEQISFNQEPEVQQPIVQQIKTRAPPTTSTTTQRPVKQVVQQEEQQTKTDDDQQVVMPLDQMIKSGVRPPLRMIISMKNGNGDVMRVPINFQGYPMKSDPKNTKTTQSIDLGEQHHMQIHIEQPQQIKQQQADDNTPAGGDFFDPSLIKPFPKIGKKGLFKTTVKVREDPVREEQTPTTKSTVHQVKSQPPQQIPELLPEPQAQQVELQPQVMETQSAKVPTTKHEVFQEKEPEVTHQIPVKAAKPALQPQTQKFQQQVPVHQHPIKKPDCAKSREDEQEHEQPMILTQNPSIGNVQMVMPKLSDFSRNKTFAQMFTQFQQALGEQMLNQQILDRQRVEQEKDEQEDLLVAMMAAKAGSSNTAEGKEMSMTVIKPPRGTSVEQAIAVHASQQAQGLDPTRTIAILQSVRSKLSPDRPASEQQQQYGDSQEQFNKPITVSVKLKPGGNVNPNPLEDSPDGGVDPDGFASSSDLSNISDNNKQRHSKSFKLARFKRGATLEAVDKLPAAKKNMLAIKLPTKIAAKVVNSTTKTNVTLAPSKVKRFKKQKLLKKSGYLKSFANMKKPTPSYQQQQQSQRARSNQKSDMIAAASETDSQSNENDGSDDLDSMSDSDSDEPDASDSNDSPSADSGSGGDDYGETNDMNDDADDAAGYGASDAESDEPYNQGASSERDYNSPTAFEIPQIDINPSTLKQEGCKTVLREVQEIPMNGLGVMQANGQPGSGYSSHGRVRRDTNSLINSRKVTSIVMTKECHFPNESKQTALKNLPGKMTTKKPMEATIKQEPRQLAPGMINPVQQQPRVQPLPMPTYHRRQPETVEYTIDLNTPQANQRYQQFVTPLHSTIKSNYITTPSQSVNTIKRRSVTMTPPPVQVHKTVIPGMEPQVLQQQQLQQQQKPSMRDFYLGADSKRNEVVAQKLYKPPSADDPYHTLSYSSKTGADPDMDSDEDDAILADREQKRTAAASRRNNIRDNLSARERQALMDPNYDDTDPVISKGREYEDDETPAKSRDSDGVDEDENDADLADESRRQRSLNGNPLPKSKQATQRRQVMKPKRPSYDPRRPQQVELERRYMVSQQQQQPTEEPRFGKSFKFTHQVSRSAPSGLMAQLSQLKPGRQGYMSVQGSESPNRGVQRGLAAVPANRRQEKEDPDENDEGDDNEHQPSGSRRRTQEFEPADEDPDADPEYNPKESHIPAHTKPKKIQKSFAYVHRDLPKKGSHNPDDFVVSYGRGNLQTEHEDYDSDRENPLQRSSSNEFGLNNDYRQQQQRRAAAASMVQARAIQPTQQQQLLPVMTTSRILQAPSSQQQQQQLHDQQRRNFINSYYQQQQPFMLPSIRYGR